MEGLTRVLCLGNELLADDAFGLAVGRQVREFAPDVVCSEESGLSLLDHVQNVARLLVVDTIITGQAPPGTIHQFGWEGIETAAGTSPHYLGLFDTLRLGRQLGLPVPTEVRILAVEAADCTTLGGPMHPAVAEAVAEVTAIVRRVLQQPPTAWQEPLGSPHQG